MAQTLLRRAAAVCGLTLLLAVTAAAVTLDANGCALYAVWSRDILWARDVGADRERVRASLVELQAGDEVFTLLLRDLNALWLSRKPREQVFEDVYGDCARRRGRYGTET